MGKRKESYKKKRRTGNPSGRRGTSQAQDVPESAAKTSDTDSTEEERGFVDTSNTPVRQSADNKTSASKSKIEKKEEEDMDFDSDDDLTGF
jgi:hypothetical protein